MKTVYVIPPTCGHTGGVVIRVGLRISGCWRTAREGGAYSLEEGVAGAQREKEESTVWRRG